MLTALVLPTTSDYTHAANCCSRGARPKPPTGKHRRQNCNGAYSHRKRPMRGSARPSGEKLSRITQSGDHTTGVIN